MSASNSDTVFLFDCFGVFYGEGFVNFFLHRYGPDKGMELKDRYCVPADYGKADFAQTVHAMSHDLDIPEETIIQEIVGFVKPRDDTFALVAELSRHYPIYLLSNCMQGMFDHVERRQEFDAFFTRKIISCDIGLIKPSEDIFRYALSLIGEGKRVLFYDDNPKNVAAACRCGIEGHVFVDAEKTREELLLDGLL